MAKVVQISLDGLAFGKKANLQGQLPLLEGYFKDLAESAPAFVRGQLDWKGQAVIDDGDVMEGKEAELDGDCKKLVVRGMIGKRDERKRTEILLWIVDDVVFSQSLKALGVWLVPVLGYAKEAEILLDEI